MRPKGEIEGKTFFLSHFGQLFVDDIDDSFILGCLLRFYAVHS